MSSALMRGQFTRFSGLGGGAEFPDPFMDVASLSIPQNIRSALYWCEFIWNYHGTYRMAMERIISYFLTDVIIDGASEDTLEMTWTLLVRSKKPCAIVCAMATVSVVSLFLSVGF